KAIAEQYAKINPLLVELNKELAEHQKTAPELTQAQTLALGPPRKAHLMVRGDFLRPGVEVEPDVPAVMPPLAKPRDGKPTRLDLARCPVGPDTPLPARVAVHSAWGQYL